MKFIVIHLVTDASDPDLAPLLERCLNDFADRKDVTIKNWHVLPGGQKTMGGSALVVISYDTREVDRNVTS